MLLFFAFVILLLGVTYGFADINGVQLDNNSIYLFIYFIYVITQAKGHKGHLHRSKIPKVRSPLMESDNL